MSIADVGIVRHIQIHINNNNEYNHIPDCLPFIVRLEYNFDAEVTLALRACTFFEQFSCKTYFDISSVICISLNKDWFLKRKSLSMELT